MSWVGPLFEVFGEIADYVAGLPEQDRQKAIDRMRAQHVEAVASLAQFKTETDADLAQAKVALHGEGEG